MPNDENVTQLLAHHARSATEDILAPESWLTTVPARANARRRRARFATAVGTLAAAGIAASIVVPLTWAGSDQRATPKPPTQLAAYNFVLSDPGAHSATQQLPCVTGTPKSQPGSSSALSIGGTGGGPTECILVQGRRDATLPSDARRVPGHGGRVYLAPPASGYRLGYRTYDDPAGGSPLILQIAVGQAVPAARLIDILDSVGLVPRGR